MNVNPEEQKLTDFILEICNFLNCETLMARGF
jgi:hypothetical protein